MDGINGGKMKKKILCKHCGHDWDDHYYPYGFPLPGDQWCMIKGCKCKDFEPKERKK